MKGQNSSNEAARRCNIEAAAAAIGQRQHHYQPCHGHQLCTSLPRLASSWRGRRCCRASCPRSSSPTRCCVRRNNICVGRRRRDVKSLWNRWNWVMKCECETERVDQSSTSPPPSPPGTTRRPRRSPAGPVPGRSSRRSRSSSCSSLCSFTTPTRSGFKEPLCSESPFSIASE